MQFLLRAAFLVTLAEPAQFRVSAPSRELDVQTEIAPAPKLTPATTLLPHFSLTITT